jgi:urease accessory protein
MLSYYDRRDDHEIRDIGSTAAGMSETPMPTARPARSYYDEPVRAEIVFSRDPVGRTYVSRQYVPYPFHICRPLYIEHDPPGMATLYVQSCSAGLQQHDDLRTSIVVEPDSRVHYTTATPTIVHSMDDGRAKQEVWIEAGAASLVEYLPDPLILFPRSRLRSSYYVSAHESSSVIAGESFLLHDYSGADGVFDWFESEMQIQRPGGTVLARDRFRLTGSVFRERWPGVNGEFAAQGSLVVLAREQLAEAVIGAVRDGLASSANIYAGVSALRDRCGVWTRLLAPDGLALRGAMAAAWVAAREVLTGVTPRPRRK